jgi:Predicted transcriptional regulators
MYSVFERIKELCKKQGITLGQLEDRLGYGRNTLYNMKKSAPNAERIAEIADYFNVSTDYLLGRNPENNKPSEDDLEKLIDSAKAFGGKPLSDKDRRVARKMLEAYFDIDSND